MSKRPRASLDQAVVNICRREVGHLSTRSFAQRLAASEDLVLRLDIYRKLEKHRGCVNTVSFNVDGDILISGSDDRKAILWDWQTGKVRFSFPSGHLSNIFQAKIIPFTNDRSIVTCAADGQVRHAQILERGQVETVLLAKHQGRAHKLAIEPGSPHILYTCGEDGLVQHVDLRIKTATELFTCREVNYKRTHMGVIHLNAIAVDPWNPNLLAVAGSDEYTRVYDIRNYKCNGSQNFGHPTNYFCPPHLIGDEHVGITGLAFSDQSELLVSYNDELIYLFLQDMGLGPDPGLASPKSLNSDASEVTASSTAMNADETVNPQVYKGHRNCETVKGVGFFGPKCEYVVSGSDCGRIFIWKKKDGELIRVMEADKHVVNCIEPHPNTTALASSGIEKDIKIWTPRAIERATLPTNIGEVTPNRVSWFESSDEDGDYPYDDFFDMDDNDDDDEDGDDDVDSDDDNQESSEDDEEDEEDDDYSWDDDDIEDCEDDDQDSDDDDNGGNSGDGDVGDSEYDVDNNDGGD